MSALNYPNLRYSGLADFEHLELLEAFPKRHLHEGAGLKTLDKIPERRRGNQDFHEHDVYSYGLGQNLTEWALSVLHAGKMNRLSHEQTARIMAGGLRRYVEGLLPQGASIELDEARFQDVLRSAIRRFSIRTRLGGGINGWVLQPLIMEGIKPLVEILRIHAVAGGPVLSHPNGHQWRYPMNVMFFLVLIAGLMMPMLFVAAPLQLLLWPLVPLLSYQVQAVVYSTIAWFPLGAGFFGVALLPLRLIIRGVARAIRG